MQSKTILMEANEHFESIAMGLRFSPRLNVPRLQEVPPGIGKSFQTGLHQTQPVEYFSEETGKVHQLVNISFCTCVRHGMDVPPWLSCDSSSFTGHVLLLWPQEYSNTTLRFTEGPEQQNLGIADLDGQASGGRFPPSNEREKRNILSTSVFC